MAPFFNRVATHPYAQLTQHTLRGGLEQPATLRRLLRESPPMQIILCAALGMGVGLLIVLMHNAVQMAHQAVFELTTEEHLSSAIDIAPRRIFLVPVLGGLALG